MLSIITFLRSIVWTSTISLALAILSIILVVASASELFPLAIVLGLASVTLATLSRSS
jgi:hypothetical protein